VANPPLLFLEPGKKNAPAPPSLYYSGKEETSLCRQYCSPFSQQRGARGKGTLEIQGDENSDDTPTPSTTIPSVPNVKGEGEFFRRKARSDAAKTATVLF